MHLAFSSLVCNSTLYLHLLYTLCFTYVSCLVLSLALKLLLPVILCPPPLSSHTSLLLYTAFCVPTFKASATTPWLYSSTSHHCAGVINFSFYVAKLLVTNSILRIMAIPHNCTRLHKSKTNQKYSPGY